MNFNIANFAITGSEDHFVSRISCVEQQGDHNGWKSWKSWQGWKKGVFEKLGWKSWKRIGFLVVLGWKSWIFIFDTNLIEYSIYS